MVNDDGGDCDCDGGNGNGGGSGDSGSGGSDGGGAPMQGHLRIDMTSIREGRISIRDGRKGGYIKVGRMDGRKEGWTNVKKGRKEGYDINKGRKDINKGRKEGRVYQERKDGWMGVKKGRKEGYLVLDVVFEAAEVPDQDYSRVREGKGREGGEGRRRKNEFSKKYQDT